MKLFNSIITDTLSLPEWVTNSYLQFTQTITSKNPVFPCYFATNAHFHNSLYFTYIESNQISNPSEFISLLREYIILQKESKYYSALVVFIDTKLKNQKLEYYEGQFWNILQCIHDSDLKPWMDSIPKDPEDSDWTFCFDNMPLFINGHSMHYIERKSRSAHCDIMLIIQSFENLSKLRKTTKNVQNISDVIRDYVYKYDNLPISNVFGNNFADPETFNWKQFWLEDRDSESIKVKSCPLKIK